MTDPTAEAIFVRDEASGALWGATPAPLRRTPRSPRWVVRHAPGVTRFARAARGIEQELAVFVARDEPVKLSLLSLTNRSDRPRRLDLFSYVEWLLGPPLAGGPRLVATELDAATGAILARDLYAAERERVAFAAASEPLLSATGDRLEFLGRNGSLDRAAALGRPRLANRFGAGLDPCAALQVAIDARARRDAARRLPARAGARRGGGARARCGGSPARAAPRPPRPSSPAWRRSGRRRWAPSRVTTPDDSFDLLVNRWLLYQNLACRLWARSGYSQSSGAYGFRDQLQDVLALAVHAARARRASTCCARRRASSSRATSSTGGSRRRGQGIRTRCSDDLLWLPYALAEYVQATGDRALLDERVPFLEAPPVPPGEPEAYGIPAISAQTGTLFEHGMRAVDRALTAGAHGLPLIGSCDWNDGFSNVGPEGRGESICRRLVPARRPGRLRSALRGARRRGRARRATGPSASVSATMLEQSWDGEWYRRAYFDDGTPLGSSQNDEGKIDSVAQTWAVLSGAAPRPRAERAMGAVRAHLVRRGPGRHPAPHAALRSHGPRPGLHQGLPSGRPRERRPVHARGGLGGPGADPARAAATRRSSSSTCSTRSTTRARRPRSQRYMTEPYAVAGDVYDHPAHRGRGGWTWYTGAAGWMYRVALEGILGLERRGACFTLNPCIPSSWPTYSIEWRFGTSRYTIVVENPERRCGGVGERRARRRARRPGGDPARRRRPPACGPGGARRGPRRAVGLDADPAGAGGRPAVLSRGAARGVGLSRPARASAAGPKGPRSARRRS